MSSSSRRSSETIGKKPPKGAAPPERPAAQRDCNDGDAELHEEISHTIGSPYLTTRFAAISRFGEIG